MKKKISLVLITLLIVSVLCTFCYATEIQPRTGSGDAVTTSEVDEDDEPTTMPQYDITHDDLFVAENGDYEMDKLVDGNVYIISNGNVKISGEVSGSVYVLAKGTVELTEDAYIIYGSLYVCSTGVKINGRVRDVYACTESFETLQNAYIDRNVAVAGNNVKLRGVIYRNVYLSAANIDVSDEQESLLIGGNFNYSSKNKIEGLEDVVLYGDINFNQEETKEVSSFSIRDFIFSGITSIVYVLVIYFILMLIASKFAGNVENDLKEKGIVAFGIGLLGWIGALIVFIASIIIFCTEVGIPVAILAWVAMFIAIYISSAVVSIAISGIIKEKVEKIKGNKGLEICTIAVVALCIWLLQKIPFVGGIFKFVILTLGLGLIIRNIIPRKTADQIITEE